MLDASPTGDALAAWTDHNDDVVRAARRPAAGPWQAHQPLSEVGVPDDPPEAVVADDGTHVVAWRDGTDNVARAAAGPTTAWDAIERMHPPRVSNEYEPYQATLAAGADVIAGWSFGNDSAEELPQSAIFGGTTPPDDGDDGGDGGGGGGDPALDPLPPPPTPPPPGDVPPPPPPTTTTALTVGKASIACRRPRGRRRGVCRIRITVTVNRAVTAKLTVHRLVKGKRKRLGVLRRALRAGKVTIVLPARVGGKALRRGSHVIVLEIAGAPKQTLRVTVR